MLRRRKIGPAFERSPLQNIKDWASRNVLLFVAAVGISFIYCFVIDFLVDNLFNFLVTGGNEDKEAPFSSNDDIWILVKLVGALSIIFLIIKSKAK